MNLKEAKVFVVKNDSGSFADPARGREIYMGISSCSDKTETIGDLRNSENIKSRIPTVWSLIRQNSTSSVSSFYPRFFWYTRHFSIVFVLVNALRKYGKTTTLKIFLEYTRWKLSHFSHSTKKKKHAEYISLRKLLRKKVFPEIPQDNPTMAPLRKGR
tara:strand:+ start:87 stop:560 length:474 start_codon:yes stop_codon:yes gene_type:complete